MYDSEITLMILFITLSIYLIPVCFITYCATKKEQNQLSAFLVSLFLSPVTGMIVMLCLPDYKKERMSVEMHNHLVESLTKEIRDLKDAELLRQKADI